MNLLKKKLLFLIYNSMKYLDNYKVFENNTDLTEEQIDFLNRCTYGKSKVNPDTKPRPSIRPIPAPVPGTDPDPQAKRGTIQDRFGDFLPF
jgi:hypothetical protein